MHRALAVRAGRRYCCPAADRVAALRRRRRCSNRSWSGAARDAEAPTSQSSAEAGQTSRAAAGVLVAAVQSNGRRPRSPRRCCTRWVQRPEAGLTVDANSAAAGAQYLVGQYDKPTDAACTAGSQRRAFWLLAMSDSRRRLAGPRTGRVDKRATAGRFGPGGAARPLLDGAATAARTCARWKASSPRPRRQRRGHALGRPKRLTGHTRTPRGDVAGGARPAAGRSEPAAARRRHALAPGARTDGYWRLTA